jgi:hypothetical protein
VVTGGVAEQYCSVSVTTIKMSRSELLTILERDRQRRTIAYSMSGTASSTPQIESLQILCSLVDSFALGANLNQLERLSSQLTNNTSTSNDLEQNRKEFSPQPKSSSQTSTSTSSQSTATVFKSSNATIITENNWTRYLGGGESMFQSYRSFFHKESIRCGNSVSNFMQKWFSAFAEVGFENCYNENRYHQRVVAILHT